MTYLKNTGQNFGIYGTCTEKLPTIDRQTMPSLHYGTVRAQCHPLHFLLCVIFRHRHTRIKIDQLKLNTGCQW